MTGAADLPKYHELMRPTLVVLDRIGGSASLDEINDTVAEMLGLSQAALDLQ